MTNSVLNIFESVGSNLLSVIKTNALTEALAVYVQLCFAHTAIIR
jgi:hypothetical protein